MTGRERMLKTFRFEEPDRPPHFENMFELEREAFGLQFPDRTSWEDCTAAEKERKIAACMEIYARIVERFAWDALLVYWPWSDPDGVAAAKRAFGDSLLIGGVVGGGVLAIEMVSDWVQFAADLYEHPSRLHEQAERMNREACDRIDRLVGAGADFILLASDVAFNAGPFLSPPHFAEFVTPYLARLVDRVKQRGAFAFFHSDGMLMPVLDQILDAQPHLLHSIDPMAGMDIAEVKGRTRGRLALMGNVQCSLLQDGPREAIRKSAR
jgi:uroporphyrinogen decarboxylase